MSTKIDLFLESFSKRDLIPEGLKAFTTKEKLDLLMKANQQEKSINAEAKNIYSDIIKHVKVDENRVQKLIDKNNKSIEMLSSIDDGSDLRIKNMIKDVKRTGSLLLNLKHELKEN